MELQVCGTRELRSVTGNGQLIFQSRPVPGKKKTPRDILVTILLHQRLQRWIMKALEQINREVPQKQGDGEHNSC